MSAENEVSSIFSLPPLIVDRIDVALAEPKHMVTLAGQGKRLMIAPKIADVIAQLKQRKSLEEAARNLSEAWGRQIGSEDLRFIVEQQMIPRGLHIAGDSAPLTPSLAFRDSESGKYTFSYEDPGGALPPAAAAGRSRAQDLLALDDPIRTAFSTSGGYFDRGNQVPPICDV